MTREPKLKPRILDILKIIAFIVCILGITQLALIPLGALSARYWSQYDGRGLNEPWFLTSSIATLLVTLLVCYLFIKFIDKKDWSYIRLISHKRLKRFLTGFLAASIVVSLLTILTLLFNVVEINIELRPFHSILGYFLLAVFGIFVLALNEELIVRGYILRTFENHLNVAAAVIFSSILFSIAHLFNPNVSLIASVNIFLMGCLVALVCIYQNSLWLPIGLHFGWNFSLWFFNFPVSGLKLPNPLFHLEYNEYSFLSGLKFGPEDSLLLTILLSGILIYLLTKYRKTEIN